MSAAPLGLRANLLDDDLAIAVVDTVQPLAASSQWSHRHPVRMSEEAARAGEIRLISLPVAHFDEAGP